jgi:hypothetical protein
VRDPSHWGPAPNTRKAYVANARAGGTVGATRSAMAEAVGGIGTIQALHPGRCWSTCGSRCVLVCARSGVPGRSAYLAVGAELLKGCAALAGVVETSASSISGRALAAGNCDLLDEQPRCRFVDNIQGDRFPHKGLRGRGGSRCGSRGIRCDRCHGNVNRVPSVILRVKRSTEDPFSCCLVLPCPAKESRGLGVACHRCSLASQRRDRILVRHGSFERELDGGRCRDLEREGPQQRLRMG